MLAIWYLVFSGFSKSSLNICKFSVHVLLKPSLKDFEHYLASMWNECNYVVEHSLALPFFGIGMKTEVSNAMAIAEFSKFAGILSAALNSVIF